MKWSTGLIEWESAGLDDVPTELLLQYFNALSEEIEKRAFEPEEMSFPRESDAGLCECHVCGFLKKADKPCWKCEEMEEPIEQTSISGGEIEWISTNTQDKE